VVEKSERNAPQQETEPEESTSHESAPIQTGDYAILVDKRNRDVRYLVEVLDLDPAKSNEMVVLYMYYNTYSHASNWSSRQYSYTQYGSIQLMTKRCTPALLGSRVTFNTFSHVAMVVVDLWIVNTLDQICVYFRWSNFRIPELS